MLQALAIDLDEGVMIRRNLGSGSTAVLPSENDLIDNEITELEFMGEGEYLSPIDALYQESESEIGPSSNSHSKNPLPQINTISEETQWTSNQSSRKGNFLKSIKFTNTKKLKKEEREKAAKVKRGEMEKAGKEVSFNKSLVSYLELCVFTGQLNKALSSLNYYRSRSKIAKLVPAVTSIAAFNTILHGFASKVGEHLTCFTIDIDTQILKNDRSKFESIQYAYSSYLFHCMFQGNFAVVLEVFKLILKDNLKPTPQSYAAVLESLGRAYSQTSSTQQQSNILQHISETIESLRTSVRNITIVFLIFFVLKIKK